MLPQRLKPGDAQKHLCYNQSMNKRDWQKTKNGSLIEVFVPGWGWADATVSDEKEGRGRVVIQTTTATSGRQVYEIYPPLSALRQRPEGKPSRARGISFVYKLQDLFAKYRGPSRGSLEDKQAAWARAYSDS